MRPLVLAFMLIFCVGCGVPQKVLDDIALIQQEEQKLYDFNQQLLKSLPTKSEKDLQAKVDLLTISRIAHHRTKTGCKLLLEYLDSTEYFTPEDRALGDGIIDILKKLRDKIDE